MIGNKHYDLIVSLGGNCSVAHNLRYRNMRLFSLPFDWVYLLDTQPIEYLNNGFKNDFKDFFLYKNLKQMPPTPEHAIIYKDIKSGYLFPNHFSNLIQSSKDYDVVATKIKRRIQRLLDKINSAHSILFILATTFEYDTKVIESLYKTLSKKYPDKDIDIRVMMFSSKQEQETIINNHININNYTRIMNNYDFTKTNYEWAFLDGLTNGCIKQSRNYITLLSIKFFHKKFKLTLSWR